MMKSIAIESNIPQIPEMIIVKGDRSQRNSTQFDRRGFLVET
jgi:hypothetical protein